MRLQSAAAELLANLPPPERARFMSAFFDVLAGIGRIAADGRAADRAAAASASSGRVSEEHAEFLKQLDIPSSPSSTTQPQQPLTAETSSFARNSPAQLSECASAATPCNTRSSTLREAFAAGPAASYGCATSRRNSCDS